MTARLLLNENFPAPAVARLREQGLDLIAIGERSPGLTDRAVMALAVAERRWHITFDRDYGELVYARKFAPPPVIVLLREPRYRPAEPAGWVFDLLRDEPRFVGYFVVHSRSSVRTRALPTAGSR